MSKQNKVNPGQYTQAGRLSADDAARERGKQDVPASIRSGSGQKSVPNGIRNRESAEEEQQERARLRPVRDGSQSIDAETDGGKAHAGGNESGQMSSQRQSVQRAEGR